MNVKIDTKEKFTVITPNEANITANMTGELRDLLLHNLNKPVPHVILNMKNVQTMSNETGGEIAASQQQFYEKNCSFVVCEVNKSVEKTLDEGEWLETMNITPTESEAWDIVQMEEIERELMRDFNDEN
jgi:anti-anti-sigma factor